MTTQTRDRIEPTVKSFLSAPIRPGTYLNLTYLALAFPLGVTYFVFATVGLSLGFSLTLTLLGPPILLLTILGAVVVAGFEAKLANALVGVDSPLPELFREGRGADETLAAALVRILTAPTTWTSVLLLGVKFVFGVVAFVAIVVLGSFVVVLLSAPFVYAEPGATYQVGHYAIESMPAALVAAGAGVMLGVIGANLLNLLALVGGLLTATLLGIDAEENPWTSS